MSAPDGMDAVAALHRCMAAGDYAGAARLVRRRATLDGLASLMEHAAEERAEADRARREAAAIRLAEADRARVQAEVGPLLAEVIGVLAGALGIPQGAVCIECRRVHRGRRSCPHCHAPVARADAA